MAEPVDTSLSALLKSRVRGIDAPALVVSDMAQARAFYCDLLGLEVVDVKGAGSSWSDAEQRRWHAYHAACVGVPDAQIQAVLLRAADGSHLELIEYRRPTLDRPPRRAPTEAGAAVTSFAVRDSETVVAALRRSGVDVLGGPVPYVLDGVSSLTTYLYDPDGNILCLFEVVAEPAGSAPR